MIIREYRDGDYEQVARVWKACFSGKLRPIDSKATIRRVIKRAPSMFLVADEKGKIVGTVYATYDGRQAIIHRLAVLPKEQRKGIGRELLKELLPRIRKLRPIEIITHANPEEHVIKLYSEVGMKKVNAIYMKRKVY